MPHRIAIYYPFHHTAKGKKNNSLELFIVTFVLVLNSNRIPSNIMDLLVPWNVLFKQLKMMFILFISLFKLINLAKIDTGDKGFLVSLASSADSEGLRVWAETPWNYPLSWEFYLEFCRWADIQIIVRYCRTNISAHDRQDKTCQILVNQRLFFKEILFTLKAKSHIWCRFCIYYSHYLESR